MTTNEEIKFAFTPVGKLDEGQRMKLMKLENSFKDLAAEIMDYVPACADRTVTLRTLLEAKFWASQSLTHYKAPPKELLQAPVKEEKPSEKKKSK